MSDALSPPYTPSHPQLTTIARSFFRTEDSPDGIMSPDGVHSLCRRGMKTHPFGSHSPAEQRRLSDLAHRAEGLLLGAVAAIGVIEALGAGRWAGVTWRVLLALAGALLLAFLYGLHPRSDWSAIWRDRQQRQHTIMAALLLASGGLELLASLSSISAAGIGWPIALLAVGWMFLAHPQHGSGDAIALATRRHRWLGATILVAGLMRLVDLANGNAFLAVAWPVALLAAAAQLFLYREPEGAFEDGEAMLH